MVDYTTKTDDRSFDVMFRKFKKKVMNDRILDDYKKHEYYRSYREKREEKHKETVRREKILLRKINKKKNGYFTTE